MSGFSAGAMSSVVGQYFASRRAACQLNNPAPTLAQAFKGLPTNMLGAMPTVAIQSTADNILKREMRALNEGKPLTVFQKNGASVTAGVISASIVSPIGNLWINQQLPENKEKGALQVIRDVLKQRGFAGFYRGLTPTILKQATRASCLLAAYPSVLNKYKECSDNAIVTACATGVTVGPAMGMLTHPLDTIETRLQGDVAKNKYQSTWQAFTDAVRTKTLWSGWRWQLVGSIANAITIGSIQQLWRGRKA